MAYDYGYGKLENELIDVLCAETLNFDAAEALIRQGADVNALGKDDDENILSEILGSGWLENGESMCAVIRFFLSHGFDVNKQDGCFGAQCLYALTLSSFDRYMIEATKLLLGAGAKNRSVSLEETDVCETPWSFMAVEGSCQGTYWNNYALSNVYEAVYQIYQAIEDGKPYGGIDSYEIAIGKKIQRVLAECDGENPVFFSMNHPQFKNDRCFTQNLYFVYDGGVLKTTRYADFWTDTVLPDVNLTDVSESFDGIVGNTIKKFNYKCRNVKKGPICCGQPITTIEMDSGRKVRFSINFGEVEDEERAAFYELLN